MQSLTLMNSESVLKEAELFAQRLRAQTPADFARDLTGPLAAQYRRHNDAWQFGYGAVDEATRRVAQFALLPHFIGSSWQGGAALPDPAIGWVLLLASGGHPGDQQHSAIRRWTAPQSGVLSITGALKHGSENGDGVRGRIVSSRLGISGEWPALNNQVETSLPRLEVKPGDTIDFVTDCGADVTSDSFEWLVNLQLNDTAGTRIAAWESSTDFHGPSGTSLPQQIAFAWQIAYQRPISPEELDLACRFVADQVAQLQRTADKSDHELTALTSLCQQLFSSNEFLHVD
jgi:hypothetical protein